MTSKEINVIKRDGSKTPLDLDKVHRMVELACEGLAGVSESHVEVNSGLQFLLVLEHLISKKFLFVLQTI